MGKGYRGKVILKKCLDFQGLRLIFRRFQTIILKNDWISKFLYGLTDFESNFQTIL